MSRQKRSQGKVAVIGAVAVALAGCMSWGPISPSFGVPSTVRVTTEDDTFVLRDAEVVGDTLLSGRENQTPRIVHLEDIEMLEEAYTNILPTLTLIVAVPLAIGFVYIATAMH